MIEMTLREALDSTNVLQALGQKQLKGRVAYNVAKILRQVEIEFNLFNETRKKLVEKYGDKDENGNPKINPETNEYVFSGDNLKAVTDDINKTLDCNITINANKIKLDDLNDVQFTPSEIELIEGFIEE